MTAVDAPAPVREPRDRNRTLLVVGICVVAAVASLAVPAAITYDAWAWLSWGRQITRGSLDTVAGPSWKPLPVLVTVLLPVTGGAAPVIWLVLTRVAGLLVLVAAYRLAARFAGAVAGVIAAGLILFTPDLDPRYLRLLFEGHTATLTALLALWAIECHLAGRRVVAFLLVVTLALDRPEAWPFLGVYALWLWFREPRTRWLLVAGCLSVPALWFGMDWWGSGSPWHGADAAQVAARETNRLGEAMTRAGVMVPVPVWILAGAASVFAFVRRVRPVLVIAGIAIGWASLVVAMAAVLGYAALSRFLLPTAALLCVLAGIGTVWIWRALATRTAGVVAAVILLAVGVPFLVERARGFPTVVEEMRERDRIIGGLDAAIEEAGGREAIVACGRVAIDDYGIPRVALAYELDLPMADVQPAFDGLPGTTFVSADPERFEEVTGVPPVSISGTTIARTEVWNVVQAGCE